MAGDSIKYRAVFRPFDVSTGVSTSVVSSEEAEGESARSGSTIKGYANLVSVLLTTEYSKGHYRLVSFFP